MPGGGDLPPGTFLCFTPIGYPMTSDDRMFSRFRTPGSRNQSSTELRLIAQDAALEVRAALLQAFRSEMKIDYKVDLHDLVTVHDQQTEVKLREFLLSHVPDSTFMGEEGGKTGEGPVHWYVDPIDGTSNFASGLAFWCVSIGAVFEGEIVAGVVYDPVANNMFSADLGGAYLNGKPMRSKAAAEETRATLITGYPVARDFRLDGRQQSLEDFGELANTFSTLRRPGSAALSICHIAAGWSDAAAGFGVNPWDVTASILILEKAGGSYKPLTLGKVAAGSPNFMCPGYVALGHGANYPTLMRVANRISERRDKVAMTA